MPYGSRNGFAKTVAAFAVILGCLVTPTAFAASGGGGGGSSGGGGSGGSAGSDPIVCREGWVYDKKQQICVRKDAGLLNDQELYEQGHDLALAGYYAHALDALEAINNKNDAMVLTMIGYSKRKLGNLEEGIAIYHQALAIDPNNINTREYLGEGYLDAGRIDLAEAELDKLQALCGTECEQYQDLAKAIAGDSRWN